MHLLNREHNAYKWKRRKKQKKGGIANSHLVIHTRNTSLLTKTNNAVCIEYSSNSNKRKKTYGRNEKKNDRLIIGKSIQRKKEFVLSFEQIHSIHKK